MAITRNLPLLLLISAFSLQPLAFSEDSINTAQAKENVGQTKTVTGVVMKVTTLPKTVALDFDGVFPNSPFNAVIFNDKLPNFDKATLESYQGKTVSVTGKIVTYKERVQIVVENPSQFVVAGGTPAAATTDSPKAPVEAATAKPASEATASSAPTPTGIPSGNLFVNGGFNKGKKEWDLPTEAEVVADGDSQVLKITLKADAPIVIKQTFKTPVAKTARFDLNFQAKLPEGSKLNDDLTMHLGSSLTDGPKSSGKAPAAGASFQEIKWSGTGASGDTLTFFLEIPPGTGTLLLDNFHFSTN